MNTHLLADTQAEEIHTHLHSHVNPSVFWEPETYGHKMADTHGSHTPSRETHKKILQTKPFKLCLTLLSLRKEMAISGGEKNKTLQPFYEETFSEMII